MTTFLATWVAPSCWATAWVACCREALGALPRCWWSDCASPLFWGAVMSVFAFLPLLGIHAVSVPAALYLLLKGRGHHGARLLRLLLDRERFDRKSGQAALDGQAVCRCTACSSSLPSWEDRVVWSGRTSVLVP